MRRLLALRAVLCEWPGCGRSALPVGAGDFTADLDHDRPWPVGPTCGCNIGPLCRWHHRVKHTRWCKQRRPGNEISWTDVTGREWLSPSQHQRPQPPLQHSAGVRPLTLAEQCARSGLLTQFPGWLQQQVRASDTSSDTRSDTGSDIRSGTSEHDAAGTPDHAGTRRLVLYALDLLDPELSLGPDRLDDELSRDEHGQLPIDPGADPVLLLEPDAQPSDANPAAQQEPPDNGPAQAVDW